MRTIFIVAKGTELVDVFIYYSLWKARQDKIETALKGLGFNVTIIERDRTLLDEVESLISVR